MRISEAYTHFRLSGEDIRLKNRTFKYDAVVGCAGQDRLPALAFYDLKEGCIVPADSIEHKIISAMLQSESWEKIPVTKAMSS